MTYDAPYQCDEHISPHFGHMIQPLDEGAWTCITCDGPPRCVECDSAPVKDEGGRCGECLSEQAQYYYDEKGGQG